jgi:serine/threonine-protein kinase
MASPPDPAQIGRYRIEGVIGRGAMGVIYRAYDPVIDRPAALKLVRTDLLDGAERADFVARFRREAQAAGRCMHPNIVTVYDFADHDGDPFIAMEYVDGQPLSQGLQSGGRMPPDHAAAVVRQVLDALGAAHAHGIVHRDIKPANILLTRDGRVKVTDFGISRFGGSTLTQSGAMIGTPGYMSPEQIRGDGVDLRSDLFSTAAVFYELLTGERPFAGTTIEQIAYRLLNERPAPLSDRLPDAPAALPAFFDVALARHPGQRFASAAAMTAALDAALRGAVAQAPAAPSTPAGAAGEGDATMVRIERQLAQHVGPIASHLIRDALRRNLSPEEVCRTVSQSIPAGKARVGFLREAMAQLNGASGARAAADVRTVVRPVAAEPESLSEAEIDRARRALARHLGPIAGILVKRALATTRTPEQLWTVLAAHIERPADRETFMRSRAGG